MPLPLDCTTITVAQTAGAASDIILRAAVVIGLILVGGVIVFAVRSYVFRKEDEAGAGPAGFTLHELRELHRTGQLSDAEFEAARTQLIGRLRGEADEEGDEGVENRPDEAVDGAAAGEDEADRPEG